MEHMKGIHAFFFPAVMALLVACGRQVLSSNDYGTIETKSVSAMGPKCLVEFDLVETKGVEVTLLKVEYTFLDASQNVLRGEISGTSLASVFSSPVLAAGSILEGRLEMMLAPALSVPPAAGDFVITGVSIHGLAQFFGNAVCEGVSL